MAAVTKEPSFDDALDVESTLWTCKECYVYQIPPLKNESGHRANDWDVNKWLWSGKLVVVAVRDTIEIRLIDEGTGNLFAMCPMPAATSKNVDPVIDSSRYFVLRIDDGKGRHAFIGLGFRDRSDSYDFNATLQDHWSAHHEPLPSPAACFLFPCLCILLSSTCDLASVPFSAFFSTWRVPACCAVVSTLRLTAQFCDPTVLYSAAHMGFVA
eukprot:6060043-Pleurochrysis_carterae.AAC.1